MKIFCYAFLIFITSSLLPTFTSCSNNEYVDSKSTTESVAVDTFKILEKYSSSITKSIYEKAYDKNNELIDYEKAKEIMLNYKFEDKNIDLSPCFSPTYTRSTGEVNIKDYLSEGQYKILETYLLKDKVTDQDLILAKQNAVLLPNDEQQIVIYIIDATMSITNGIFQEISNLAVNTRAAKRESVTFVCNLGAGMIGAVTGFLAGCFTGPAAPLVGSIVSTAVGAYISTKAC